MTGKLALAHVYDSVVAFMAADAAGQTPPVTAVPHLFGRRERDTKTVVGPRIVWLPGDPNGRIGVINPPRAPGRNPRSLATLEELCTVEITCEHPDPTKTMDERAQYEVTRALFDAWFRALYTVAHGAFRIIDTSWVAPDRKVLRHGDAIRVVLGVQAVVADEPLELAPALTNARISTALADTAEATTVETTTTVPSVTDAGGDLVLDEDGNLVTEEAP